MHGADTTDLAPGGGAATPESPARTFVYSLVGNLYLVLATLILGSLAAVLGWLPPRGDWTYRLARWWSAGLLAASGVTVRESALAPLDPRRGYVFMANHQSIFDIPVLIRTLPGQSRFLAKRSLFRIPIFGWALAAGGFVPVDRKNRKRAKQTFDAAIERLRSGKSIVLFPEETRSLDGSLLPFKRGGFLMALKSGYPIVPVAIQGTLTVQSKKSFLIRPAEVRVVYGEPIEASGYGIRGRDRLAAEVRARLTAQLASAGGEPSAGGREAGEEPR